MRPVCLVSVLLLVSPASHAGDPQLSDYWPNQDGLLWIYDQWSETPDDTTETIASMYFEGTCDVPGGIEVQSLVATVTPPPPPALSRGELPEDPFLARLWIARPDLRQKISAQAGGSDCPEETYDEGWDQLLLAPLNYVRTVQEIAAWRTNTTALRAWLWLEDPLTPGNTFDLQLIPDIANDVWLHATVIGTETVIVPAGTFPGSLKVEYVIDYGVSECTESGKTPTGQYRARTHGFVHYAPGVGPVQSSEEFIPLYEIIFGSCAGEEGAVAFRGSLKLRETGGVSVETVTWGALKARFQ